MTPTRFLALLVSDDTADAIYRISYRPP